MLSCRDHLRGSALPGASRSAATASGFSSRRKCISCVNARSLQLVVRAAFSDRDERRRLYQTGLVVSAVFNCLMTPHRANAIEHIWKPRRHHRRLGERFDDSWPTPIVEKVEQEERRVKEARLKELEAARAAAQQRKALKQAQREERQRKLEEKKKTEKTIKKAKEVLLTVATTPRAVGEFVTDHIGVANLAIFLGLVALLLRFVLARPLMAVWSFITGGGWQPQGGRWVYDRSLGGKKVWVPDEPPAVQPSAAAVAAEGGAVAAAQAATKRSRMTDADFDVLTRMAAAASRPVASEVVEDPNQLPGWWKVEGGSQLNETSRSEKLAAAEKLLRSIEKRKVAGADYPLSQLIRLREICQEAWVTVAPATVGGRDAMYRTAVEGAIRASMDPVGLGGDLGGWSPQQLVAGLAQDLTIPDDRAVKILRSCLAAEMRTRLVEVVSAVKKQDLDGLMLSLMQLADLQRNLPVLSQHSPEVELIASSLSSRATLAERQALLEISAQLAPESAALFAALLGFDAQLVLPQLAVKLGMQRMGEEGQEAGEQ